jgi:hypothetical protein
VGAQDISSRRRAAGPAKSVTAGVTYGLTVWPIPSRRWWERYSKARITIRHNRGRQDTQQVKGAKSF